MDLKKLQFHFNGIERDIFYRDGNSDYEIILQILQKRDYDFVSHLSRGSELVSKFSKIKESGKQPIIVDCGANIGISALFFDAYLPGSKIVAVEPEESNFSVMMKNVAGLDIDCRHAGVWSEKKNLVVFDPGFGAGHCAFQVKEAAADQGLGGVGAVTINDIFNEYGDGFSPFIVKIDIEGSEGELFSKNTEWVSRTPLIIIELHDWLLAGKANSRNFLKCISQHDRDFVYVGENIFSIMNPL